MQLQDGEQVLLLVRPHLRSMFWHLAAAAILIALPFFFLFPLMRAGTFGILLLCLLLAAGVAFALRVFLIWDSHVLILTNRRLVHVEQTGVWRRRIYEIPLTGIEQSFVERRGPIDTMFRTGVLHVRGNGHASIAFLSVPRPEGVLEQIQVARAASPSAGFQLKSL